MMRRILLLSLSVLLAGCKFDQGPRIEMTDFLKQVGEEDVQEKAAAEIVFDPDAVRPPDVYTVGPGDTLDISITGLVIPQQIALIQRRIRQDGKIHLPLLEDKVVGVEVNMEGDFGPPEVRLVVGKDAEINVEGLTPERIERIVNEKYSPAYIKDPQITVTVSGYKLTPAVVLGQVSAPGLVNLKRDELNVLTAIARAGWIKEASDGRVTVRRADGGKETFQLWMASDISRAMNYDIESGDMIEVGRRPSDSAYVMGLVKNPSAVPIQLGAKLTFMQLLASVGGLDSNFDPRDATLVRIGTNGEPLRVRVDLNRMFNNSDPDFDIKPGDIVDIYHTDRTRAIEWFNKLVHVGAGVDLSYNPFYMGLNPFRGATSSLPTGPTGAILPPPSSFSTFSSPAK